MIKKTRVLVTVKKDVLDPAGVAVKKALQRQGLLDLVDVRVGKIIDISYKSAANDEHVRLIEQAAETMLSNPIVEDFSVETIDETSHEHMY